MMASEKEYPANTIRQRPAHPGRIVKNNLEALGMSINAAAIAIGVSRGALTNLVNEKAAVSPEMALRLGKLFRNGPQLLLNMQQAIDLWDASQKIATDLEAIQPADREGRENFEV
jgi:addiction module HigA family antidote